MWMRSSKVVRASDCQCQSHNCSGFDPSILRHSGIWGAADEAVVNNVYRKKIPPLKQNSVLLRFALIFLLHFAYLKFVFASAFFWLSNFLVHFRFATSFSLYFAYLTFVFASDFCCVCFDVKQAKSCLFPLPSETEFSLQFKFSLLMRKRETVKLRTQHKNFEIISKLHFFYLPST
jgi:hypothetical protein